MSMRRLFLAAPLALAFGCADPLPGDWEMTQGWCVDEQACEPGTVVDYPVVVEQGACTLTESGSLNITDDLDGAFNLLFTVDGEDCEFMDNPVRFEIDEIEELEKNAFYQIDIDFGQFEESLDCRLKSDDSRLDCVSLHTQQDILFER